MAENAATFLTPWSSYYVMTGSSAAALTGLMFVVITLMTGEQRGRSRDGTSTFSTPTVVHFCAALLISAVLSAPWHSLAHPAVVLGLAGLCGVGYTLRIMHRTWHFRDYAADLEDWTWYGVLPLVAYGAALGGAIGLLAAPSLALFALAGAALLLIFIGIHNAWDVVTFIAIVLPARAQASNPDDESKPGP